MKKQYLLLLLTVLFVVDSYSQQFPQGTCGTANLYDANGNRRTRKYFCNNGTNYPQRTSLNNPEMVVKSFEPPDNATQPNRNLLYPNPTTGQFYITFENELKNAKISLLDMNGKTFQYLKASGTKFSFDLTGMASGIYMVKIEEGEKVTIKKVVKQ